MVIHHLKRIKGGAHRSNIKNKILLDRNERIIPFSSKILNDLNKQIINSNLNYYPDFNNFYSKLSKWLNKPVSNIFLTEGLDGAVQCAFRSYTKENVSNIIVPDPSFAMYKVYAKIYNVKFKTIGYDKNFNLKYEDIFKLADKNTSIVFLPNPNMPIEGFLDNNHIEKIGKFCNKNKIILFIDEVYFHFNDHTSINLINKYNNVIVARSFSKAFGLAGIRLGYIISNSKNIKYISNSRSGYETNSVSTTIASYFINNFKYIENYVKEIRRGLIYVKKELSKKNIFFTSAEKGNYIFIRLKNDLTVKKIYKHLLKKNIYVRIGWKKPYTNYLCVSASNIKNSRLFIKEFLVAKDLYE